MNCLYLTRKKPAGGNTKRAGNAMAIWINKCNEIGQLPAMGEPGSRFLEPQKDAHNVTLGRP
jgi:hypothetical protein